MFSVNQLFARIMLIIAIAMATACSDSELAQGTSRVDLSFSDAAVDDASEVVITVDKITFQRNSDESEEDIVVDTFSNADGSGAETFTLDLLTVQGEDSRLVVDDVQLPVGDYNNMLIEVIDTDNLSYVVDAEGSKPLKVPSNTLKLGSFVIEPTSTQAMVVEFGLQQSMTYNPGPDRYLLKPRGVRIVSVDKASLITGTIDHATLQADSRCLPTDTGGTMGNIYLYSGNTLDSAALTDNFDPETQNNQDRIAPVASSSLDSDSFSLAFLEAGDYTLAVGCSSVPDDADLSENLVVPTPENEILEFGLGDAESITCNIPLTLTACSTEPQE